MPDHSFLRLENLSKSFIEGNTSRHVLQDVNARFACGEITAIVGRSGSGKSTLLNLVSGIDQADHGCIYLDEVELTALSERERTLLRRQNIGFVFQFFNLIPTLNVLENVTLPLELMGAAQKTARSAAETLLDAVGLLDRCKTFPDRLSGGEQQRVAICRALMNDPELLLADEPTGQLDSRTAGEIMGILARMNERGKTVIVVTHDPVIAACAKRIIRIKDGVIVDEQTD